MRTAFQILRPIVLTLLVSIGFAVSTPAQEVSIPDPGLNAAIRAALQIPVLPLTEQDMLNLTNLDASSRNISNLQGLAAARNLVSLDLHFNQLTNFSLPSQLTNLMVLDLSLNSLTNCSFPGGLMRLATLNLKGNLLTKLTLPAGLNGLSSLDLSQNRISRFSLPANLTSLSFLDLNLNEMTNILLPNGLTNLARLNIGGNNTLTDLNLPQGLTALETLNIDNNGLSHVSLPVGMKSLLRLNLEVNALLSLSLPAGMTNLAELILERNHLDSLALPADLTKLAVLDLFGNGFQLTNITIPGSLTALVDLDLAINGLTTLALPAGLTNLANLDLFENTLTSLTLPAGLTALTNLDLGVNQLTRCTLPAGLTSLAGLDLFSNQLTTFTVPADATNLINLFLSFNQLTNVSLPPNMTKLQIIGLSQNKLKNLDLPSGLTSLSFLNLNNNQLTNVIVLPDMQQLTGIFLDGNPLTTLVLSEPLAVTNLAATVSSLRNQGVFVFTYPLAVSLVSPHRAVAGAFEFTLTGPPGIYSVLASTNLAAWSEVGVTTSLLGSAVFSDASAGLFARKFYRALQQSPPANMVFIPPNTFAMGSPTNELDRATDEGPQTIVTLTRGYWIGKYEVTQGEYLSVMGTNPSPFPGDPNRPVTSVSWPDATNYCAKLTQRELAAGRIPAGSQYRLPTEAEWECAARAGTSTRFSYGDDAEYSSLGSHAWYASNSSFTPHPVGQKLPNPWGLYDMEGNVVEWCQDWFGSLPGGFQADPTGPASSSSGRKVTRGGAFDNTQQSCRSAERSLFNAGPFDTDTDLGFRVALVTEPHGA